MMKIEEAEKLASQTDYAVFAAEQDLNPINRADAGQFFLAGYEYAISLTTLQVKGE